MVPNLSVAVTWKLLLQIFCCTAISWSKTAHLQCLKSPDMQGLEVHSSEQGWWIYSIISGAGWKILRFPGRALLFQFAGRNE